MKSFLPYWNCTCTTALNEFNVWRGYITAVDSWPFSVQMVWHLLGQYTNDWSIVARRIVRSNYANPIHGYYSEQNGYNLIQSHLKTDLWNHSHRAQNKNIRCLYMEQNKPNVKKPFNYARIHDWLTDCQFATEMTTVICCLQMHVYDCVVGFCSYLYMLNELISFALVVIVYCIIIDDYCESHYFDLTFLTINIYLEWKHYGR